MDILWDNRSEEPLPPDWEAQLTDVLQQGILYTGAPPRAELSISFVDAAEMRMLNQAYRQIDRETDVLSFPCCEPGETLAFGPYEPPVMLGDIVICVARARAQATEYQHTFIRELAFLIIHGLLHLLGYDHETAPDERDMRQAQTAILQKAGIFR